MTEPARPRPDIPRRDTDRLTQAFDALRGDHIIVAEDFTCCMTCGIDEIGGERDADSRGFVFYHEQDVKRARSGQGLLLAYGAFGGDPERSLAIGNELAGALRAAGLSVEWDGTIQERILVKPLDWRTRPATRR